MALVLMKIFEAAPGRFDRWMDVLTFGRLQRVREQIAHKMIRRDATVLEIGCGSGSLLEILSSRCAHVVGIDTSAEMVEASRQRISKAATGKVEKLHALQIEDEYDANSFDQIVSVLAFSEMSDDEIDCLLLQCERLLKPGGELILADELEPGNFLARGAYRVYRYFASLLTYLGMQASEIKKGSLLLKFLYFIIELPLMLLAFVVAAPASHPLRQIDRRLARAGFDAATSRSYLGGTLRLLCASATKRESPDQRCMTSAIDRTSPEPDDFWHRLIRLPRIILLQYLFRSIPYPTTPRLIRVGNPGRTSPVLVTSNYDLTVRRVCRALGGMDGYLLVAPAAGVDVWCAAGGGRFTVDSIISILKTSRIAELVDHRRLILPQLCANGINLVEVSRRTGWGAVFGPADAADIPAYLQQRDRSERMMRVTFTVRERLEMALAMWGSLSLRYTIFPVLIFGLAVAPWFVLILAVLTTLLSLGCYALPGKTFVQKAGVLFLSFSAIILAGELFRQGWISHLAIRSVLLLFAAAYLVGSSYPSYTPLWQCGYSKLFFGFPNLRLTIMEEKCAGCKLCNEVCPVGCFSPSAQKMVLSRPDLCQGCMACLVQCPADAIINQLGNECPAASSCH
jgi:ubiquinone/menaquinone biosynthesis C-methylase UbiE/NAD-dependent dihydropyrimidine dehydrogenase PreA subunit